MDENTQLQLNKAFWTLTLRLQSVIESTLFWCALPVVRTHGLSRMTVTVLQPDENSTRVSQLLHFTTHPASLSVLPLCERVFWHCHSA